MSFEFRSPKSELVPSRLQPPASAFSMTKRLPPAKNSQPLKSEVKNPPHPPWFEASTDINIFMFIFRRFYQVVSLKPPNHSNQKPRTFLVCKNVKLFFFENTTSYHVSFFMLFTHRWKNTGNKNTQPNFALAKFFLIYTNKGIIISSK